MMRPLAKFLIWLLGVGALAMAFFLAVLAEYKSPESRLWVSSIGYPAIARHFDRPIPVPVTTAEMRQVEPSISAAGKLVYREKLSVPVEMPGIIHSVEVEAGQRVSRGDTLFRIDKGGKRVELARVDVALKRAAYEATTRSLERTQRMRADGLITYDALYDYESDHRKAVQALTLAEETLRLELFTRSEVLFGKASTERGAFVDDLISAPAPIDGIVRKVGISLGQTALEPMDAVVLAANLMFLAYVDQMHFSRVVPGQGATIYLLAGDGVPLTGTVQHVEPFVAGATTGIGEQPARSFPIWLSLDVTDKQADALAEGMNGYLILSYPEQRLVIPSRALLRYSGGEGLIMVVEDDNRVALRQVGFSWSDGINVAISEGLSAGERLVLDGHLALVEGDEIEPR